MVQGQQILMFSSTQVENKNYKYQYPQTNQFKRSSRNLLPSLEDGLDLSLKVVPIQTSSL